MPPKVKVSVKDSSPGLKAALQGLAKAQVKVGIPQATSNREKGEINNAELLYIHTNGSQLKNIPARPVLEPALENAHNRSLYLPAMEAAVAAALRSDSAGVQRNLELAGVEASGVCIDWFVNPENGWKENSERTIKAKGSDRPLIDTQQLRRSITYVVEAPRIDKAFDAKLEPMRGDAALQQAMSDLAEETV